MSPESKRRKLRKGTHSCWECKRRKIRCTFVASTESVCDGCKSRRVPCVGQEFEDEAESAKTDEADRLNRVEALVEQLARRTGSVLPSLLTHDIRGARTRRKSSSVDGDRDKVNAPFRALAPAGRRVSSAPDSTSEGNHAEICGNLLAAWPDPHELDRIFSLKVGTSILFHGVVCKPYSTILDSDKALPSPCEMLQLPPPGSHPVLVARKLLMLGSFLQGVSPAMAKDIGSSAAQYSRIAARLVETASVLVTSNDNLVDSLDGIECIMIESMYLNNAGNLRQAWLKNRRAMLLAQLMGLDRGRRGESPNMLEADTQKRIDPDYMWFRLIMSDRYLSLMLGLPQGSRENPYATPEALRGCGPLDRMERIDALVGGLILKRNRDDLHDLGATQEIDRLLQDGAATMPAQWWLTPAVLSVAASDANAFRDTIRIMSQLAHFHLLAQLHLPYMLQPSTDQRYDYSKLTAVAASREILSRFVLFRRSTTVAAYCRGVDCLAFVASTVLCLASIVARGRNGTESGIYATVFGSAHQRLGDRGLMEQTLQLLEEMEREGDDSIARKVANVLRRLLEIEAATAGGVSHYNASLSFEPDDRDVRCDGSVGDGDDTLCVNIPHLGTFNFHRAGGGKSGCQNSQVGRSHVDSIGPGDEVQVTARQQMHFGVDESPFDTQCLPALDPMDDWTLEGVDYALFDNIVRGAGGNLYIGTGDASP